MLCRSLFLALSRASSKAAAAVAGLFAVGTDSVVDGARDTWEVDVKVSRAL